MRPWTTGIVNDVCVSADRICAGMSSGPSSWCLYLGSFSGASLSK